MNLAPILVIEDDAVTSAQFCEILKAAGFPAQPAGDLQSAMARLAEGPISAVLLDWHLPDMCGLGGVRAVKAIRQKQCVRVAVITGDYFLDDTIPGQLEALDVEIRFKPIWPDDLLELAGVLVAVSPAQP